MANFSQTNISKTTSIAVQSSTSSGKTQLLFWNVCWEHADKLALSWLAGDVLLRWLFTENTHLMVLRLLILRHCYEREVSTIQRVDFYELAYVLSLVNVFYCSLCREGDHDHECFQSQNRVSFRRYYACVTLLRHPFWALQEVVAQSFMRMAHVLKVSPCRHVC